MSSSQVGEADLLLDVSQISEHLEKLTYLRKGKKLSFKKQAERLKNCRKKKNLFLCEDGFKEIGQGCNYRICLYCGKVRSWRYISQYYDLIKPKRIARSIYDNGLRHVILTLKNQKDIEKGVTKLYESFRKLRRRKYCNEKIKGKKRLRGGLGVIHIKIGKDGLWNIHFHFLIDSSYLDMKSHKKKGGHSKFVTEWKECTGGSGVLQIKRVRSQKAALEYVLIYITRELDNLGPKDMALFFKATFGRRLLFTFGDFYGIKKPKKKSKFQYISPHSPEGELYYDSMKKKTPKNILDYEKEVIKK